MSEAALIEQVLDRLDSMEKKIDGILNSTLTIEQVAEYTGLSKGTILNMTSSRRIPHYKRGKFLFFDRDEIDAWIREKKVKTHSDLETQAINYTFKK